ncbi:hypothetical protein SAMN04489709_1141, partial [Paracidovorax citrulli]
MSMAPRTAWRDIVPFFIHSFFFSRIHTMSISGADASTQRSIALQ